MTPDLWARTSGTWMNVLTVALGSGLGLFLQEKLPTRMQRVIIQGVGLLTIFLGLTLASKLLAVQAGRLDGIIVGLIALVAGGLLGEGLKLEVRLEQLGDWLQRRFRGQGRFTEGFVTASLLFCVGPMTLIGSLNNGLRGDDTLLMLKAVMDGITAIALTGSYGPGVACSLFTILLYQGGLSLAAGALAQTLPDPAQDPHILIATGIGGLMILGTGLNLLDMAKVPVASFLPALVLGPLVLALAVALSS